ncbi:RNA polymerase sigma factor [Haloferula sp. BvORR071]|uniref:RNA polymerase sigma factor n=1 Tax=Haloferula sp. BvORR071 TaxID=1396141 RepID=UPI000556C109|nr:RNA polymerase sigma factor [Haloferula sp. BvORR071]
MENSGPSDPELLAEWLEQQREAAFRTLVTRYAGLVLMTARRTCGGDDSLAEEASQLTFLLLARKAKSLLTCASLGGWLHRAALMHSKNLLRATQSETRKREKLLATMNTHPPASPGDPWQDLQPVLDEALAGLPDKYREALLLRFYRSLGVREIGETLGISTDAAQKRIDRATSRLRDKLVRLGCPVAGTSLGALLLAGFTADAQAAAAAGPLIAGKVLAASAASSTATVGSSTFITTLSVKASSYVIPATLILAITWLVSQRLALAKLEGGNATLISTLASTSAPSRTPATRKRIPTALDTEPLDWLAVAKELADHEWTGQDASYLTLRQHLFNGFYSLSSERLVTALDEIEGLKFEPRQREALEKQLYMSLLEIDPETAMTRSLKSKIDRLSLELLGQWADKAADKASVWLDARLAAGDHDGSGVGKFSDLRISLEQKLIYPLIRTHVDLAGRRLAALPERMRYGIMFEGGGNFPALQAEHDAGFARMVREQLPAQDASRAIVGEAVEHRFHGSFEEIESYWQRTAATEEERRSIIVGVANDINFPRKSGKPMQVAPEDLDALRSWVGKQAPDLADKAITMAIGQLANSMKYPELVTLALHCLEQGCSDDVLRPVLAEHSPEHAALRQTVISRISDPVLRADVLQDLQSTNGK